MAGFDFIRTSCLALIQGLTEFLPISSSAHLIFPSALFGWEDQGLAFDVAVHFGTLLAVIVYFSQDIYQILSGWILHVVKGQASVEARLGWMIILATCPLIIAGLLLQDIVDTYFRSTTVIASTTIIFALLLWFADKNTETKQNLNSLNWRAFLMIGLAQVLALVPGTSRSGVTMTAGLFCKLNRKDSARLSFLLSIPAIAGAALLLLIDLLSETSVNWLELAYALILSAIVAYLCIHYFLKLVTKIGFVPFVVYRLLLGAVLFLFFV
jgi:undecaprenyl-diphosphatase